MWRTVWANVLADDAVGLKAAVEHLVHLGHKRIGFISSGFAQLFGGVGDIGTAREALFARILESHDLSVPDGYITHEIMDVFGPNADAEANCHSVLAATHALLKHSAGRPTAICCWRDETAMVAIQACEAAGLRVPEDISVVGFSDLSTARFFRPPLSTVQSPWDELGRMAVHQLGQRMEDEFSPLPSTHFVPSRFVARKSTGPAPDKTYEELHFKIAAPAWHLPDFSGAERGVGPQVATLMKLRANQRGCGCFMLRTV